MRLIGILAATAAMALSFPALAQKAPSGSDVTGNPSRTSAERGLGTTTTGESRSGSGTSTSGGRDDNGNQGRDAMPDSSISVRPLDKQNRNPNGSPK